MAQILRISEASSIGIHAMILLTLQAPSPVRVREIASAFSVSEAHCSKVMQRLVRCGMAQAIRGPRGGFRLLIDPTCTSMLDVYEAIEGALEDTRCLFQIRKCENGCIFDTLMGDLNQQLREHFSSTTLRAAAEALARKR